MTYNYDDIALRLAQDPIGAISDWEQDYQAQINAVGRFITANREKSPVVLLAGPSASSKTSTAGRIRDYLEYTGVHAHLLSMDDYFLDRDSSSYPTLPDGQQDLESPECLDTALLDEHFSILERGEDIYVPTFDFSTQKRAPGPGTYLDAERGDVFIFEGIHALNPRFTQRHPHAARVYVSPDATYLRGGEVFCSPVELRLMRRIVRDHLFRSASAEYSLSLWENVIAGEAKNILPFKDSANCTVTTALPYELGILKRFVAPLLEELQEDVPCRAEVDAIRRMLRNVNKVNPALVPDDSILREFIGARPAPAEKG